MHLLIDMPIATDWNAFGKIFGKLGKYKKLEIGLRNVASKKQWL